MHPGHILATSWPLGDVKGERAFVRWPGGDRVVSWAEGGMNRLPGACASTAHAGNMRTRGSGLQGRGAGQGRSEW